MKVLQKKNEVYSNNKDRNTEKKTFLENTLLNWDQVQKLFCEM